MNFLEALTELEAGKCIAIKDKYHRFYQYGHRGNLAVWCIWPDSRSTYHDDFLQLPPSLFLDNKWGLVMSVREFD